MSTDKSILNPFLTSGYVSPEYFCDRKSETEKLIGALENGRNVSLISPRRMGKTGLILHTFHEIRTSKDISCIYIDIFPTQNLHDFTVLLAKKIIGELDTTVESVRKRVFSFFRSIRPVFSIEPLSNVPTLSVELQDSQTETGLDEIFQYLKNSGQSCYIALDEFQQITEYPEKGVEALLRSYVQFLPNVKFIFAGSKKHLMDAMFTSAGRPFYQSTQKLTLSEIPEDSYSAFASYHFEKAGKKLPLDVFHHMYRLMAGHTWYIQDILNILFALPYDVYTKNNVDTVLLDILEAENSTYKTYCELVSKGQYRLLRAIACAGKVKEPYESMFMRKNGLTAPSSVRQALKVLIDKGLVLHTDDDGYIVYDRFFSLWLARG